MSKFDRFTNSFGIDRLIDILKKGGTLKTGVDIYSEKGNLLLGQDLIVSEPKVLLNLKKQGVARIPVLLREGGGLWDKSGKDIQSDTVECIPSPEKRKRGRTEIDRKLDEIAALKHEAAQKYDRAKHNIKKIIADIKNTGGKFDYRLVEETVTDLFTFITENDNAFSYLTREIFSYDDYLYNHSINTCTIATAVLQQFNKHLSASARDRSKGGAAEDFRQRIVRKLGSFRGYRSEELHEISIGYFLHDVGKVLIPDAVLNKKGQLTDDEFALVKSHSFEKGVEILDKNNLDSACIKNIVAYHHAALFANEDRCYPHDKAFDAIPLYVKICKLSDMYDAMTSKRCYKEAFNPIRVVTDIFRKYARKEEMLQFVLYSFVKSIGIYPPGSIVSLTNGQLAYVLDGTGPIVLPFTDTRGMTLGRKQNPIDFADASPGVGGKLEIDTRKPLRSPMNAYALLPSYLKKAIETD